MTINADGILQWLPIAVTLLGVLLVSQNARRANSTHMQNVDLARIRDLRTELAEAKSDLAETRSELTDTRTELAACNRQAHQLMQKLQQANHEATESYLLRQEMIRYASMPGVDIDMWLRRFAEDAHRLKGS